MISYDNPVCPTTKYRANLFCSTEGCTKPAFACGEQCLYEEGHFENGALHRVVPWSLVEESVRLAIDLPLSKEELLHLEKQEKQVRIVIEELKSIHSNHEQTVRKLKKQLNLKGIANKVLTAVRDRTTHQITGNDMAELLTAINNDNIFANYLAVTKAI